MKNGEKKFRIKKILRKMISDQKYIGLIGLIYWIGIILDFVFLKIFIISDKARSSSLSY